MSKPRIKVDKMLVKDHHGWKYKNAFIVVRDIEATIHTSAKSKDGADGYDESSKYDITYTGNYWMDKGTQEADLASRPLGRFVDVPAEELFEVNNDGEYALDDKGDKKPTGEVIPAHSVWVEVHKVDTEHLQSKQVLSGALTGIDERDRLVELDINRKFAPNRV